MGASSTKGPVILPSGERVAYFQREVETASRGWLREHQWRRLQALVAKVAAANPFYRAKWAAAGFTDPRDLRTWDDFHRLPFTTKQELGADQEAHPPFGANLSAPPRRYVRFHQTSGTTGRPLAWPDTAGTWDWYLRCWGHVYRGAGVGPGDRVFVAFSFGPFIGFWGAFDAAPKVGALTIPGGGQDTLQRLHAILDNRATVLVATPTYALRLGEAAAEHNLDIASSSIRVTIHAGEPGASIPATKARLEALWGARSFDHYGMTEAGAMAFECQARPGGMHLIESEFIFEVLDPETGAPKAEGELVITTLGRWARPLFRYHTGDRVCLEEAPCPCGRTFARLQGGILGRVDDMITVRGVNVFPSAIENILRRHPEVGEFLGEVRREKGMHELRLKLELDPARVPDIPAFLRGVQADIYRHLYLRIEVEAVAPGSLPRYELKSRRFLFVD